jgi:hypothetical protein
VTVGSAPGESDELDEEPHPTSRTSADDAAIPTTRRNHVERCTHDLANTRRRQERDGRRTKPNPFDPSQPP